MFRAGSTWALAVCLGGGAIKGAAQQPQIGDSTPHTAKAPDSFCWRGKPLSRCRTFMLFELSAPRHLAGTTIDPAVTAHGYGYKRWDQGLASQFLYDVGAMVNVGDRSAIGGTLTAGLIVDDPGRPSVLGATARYRRWLTNDISADAGAGVLRMPVGIAVQQSYGVVRRSVERPALAADVRLGFGDLLALTGRAMVANDGRGRTHDAFFAGVSTGSTVTAAVTAVYAGLVGYYLTITGGGRGDKVTAPASP